MMKTAAFALCFLLVAEQVSGVCTSTRQSESDIEVKGCDDLCPGKSTFYTLGQNSNICDPCQSGSQTSSIVSFTLEDGNLVISGVTYIPGGSISYDMKGKQSCSVCATLRWTDFEFYNCDGSGLSGGAIAGIVIGVLVVVVIGALAGFYFVRRRAAGASTDTALYEQAA